MDIEMHIEVDLPRTRPVRTFPRVLDRLSLKRIIPDSRAPFWYLAFLMSSLIAISLDPLFLYIPLINDDKKCIGIDKKLGDVAIALRSIMDFFHLIYIFLPLRNYSAIRLRYLRRFCLIDLLSILPLPQVILFVINGGSKHPNAMKLLLFFVIIQYLPRVIRIYPLFKIVTRAYSYRLDDATFAKAAFNLLLYMLASHVYGALWYFSAIERETACWKRACINHPTHQCTQTSFYCHDKLGNYTLLNDLCPIQIPNTTLFNFGIYLDALQSGIVEVTDFPVKFFHSFLWGLQNLSCFGQNLQTSSYVWENVFAISITLSGLVFFLYLVGNMQIYMQSKRVRSEEKRLDGQEIEEWSGFKRLPGKLQRDIRKYRQLLCRETGGSDVDSSLDSLPKSLRRTTKSALCLTLLRNVPIFDKMDRHVLEEVCNLLKFRKYNEGIEIVQKGNPYEEMHFVMQGNLLSMATEGGGTNLSNSDILKDGDFFGLDLILWSLDPHSSTNDLPISTKTIRTCTEVETCYLTADDSKVVASILCKWFNITQIQHALRCYSEKWRTWAAYYIQAVWRCHIVKKQRNRQDEWLMTGGISSSSGANYFASQFVINRLLVSRCDGNASLPTVEKPEEPCFTDVC